MPVTTPSPAPSLYDLLSAEAPEAEPGPETSFTATKETLDNDREDVEDDVLNL